MQKEFRLKKNEHFQQVFKRGSSAANRQLVLYTYRNPTTKKFRLGISISKKVGQKAVVRNRMKRLLKEAVRENGKMIMNGYDLVLIVRKPALDLDFQGLCSSFRHVLKRTEAFVGAKKRHHRRNIGQNGRGSQRRK